MVRLDLHMRVRDLPLALKWLQENYNADDWSVGEIGYSYSENLIQHTIQLGEEGFYLRYDENTYREETIFYFTNPEQAMTFKLIWA